MTFFTIFHSIQYVFHVQMDSNTRTDICFLASIAYLSAFPCKKAPHPLGRFFYPTNSSPPKYPPHRSLTSSFPSFPSLLMVFSHSPKYIHHSSHSLFFPTFDIILSLSTCAIDNSTFDLGVRRYDHLPWHTFENDIASNTGFF